MGQAKHKEAARRRIVLAGRAYPVVAVRDPCRVRALDAVPARARPPLVFAAARFGDLAGDLPPLWEAHWLEIGEDRQRVPLDPDWERYRRLDDLGHLEITAARRGGALVGYLFSIVDTHLHYRGTLCAFQDLRYLAPDCRGGRNALRLGRAHDAQLQARGVVKAIANVKVRANRDGRLFEHMGYRPFEATFAKAF